MTLGYRLFGDRNSSRGGRGAGPYGSDWSGPFLSPSSLDPVWGRDPGGLPAVASAVRLISETIGSFVMRAYTGDASARQPVLDAPQSNVLQDASPGYCTSVDLWSDVVTSIEVLGDAFIWKGRRKAGGEVVELWPFPAENACVYVDEQGNKIVEARINGGERIDITDDVIHVRGWSPCAGVEGVSKPREHGRTLQGAMALQEFVGRYFDNDSQPSFILTHPGSPDKKQREEFRDSWNARHRGPGGEKMGLLWGNMSVQQLTSSLDQSQVAQLMSLEVMDVARIFGIYPRELLISDPTATLPDAEPLTDLFHRITLLSRIRRIERAVSADRDLFPDRALYCGFDSMNFTRGSVAVASTKVHALKQVGMITANEGRSELGYPPSTDPGADKLLETPVGAGANKAPDTQQQLALFLEELQASSNSNGSHAELSPADSTA